MGELVPQVGQFFLNGGSTAWIMRIADATAASAAVTLNNEAGQPVLRLTAADAGADGNLTRAEVDYGTANPESTFNLTLYRRLVGPTGTVTRDGLETFTDLSMDPASGRFIETVVNSASLLVSAQVDAGVAAMVAGVPGVSISGLILPAANADVFTAIAQRFGNNAANNRSISIAVDGQPAIPVTFAQGADLPGFIANMQTAINNRLAASGMTGAVIVDVPAAAGVRQLHVTSNGGSVVIGSAQQSDVAAGLQLGVVNGGIEISRWSRARPAPTGIVARLDNAPDDLARLRAFATTNQDGIGDWRLTAPGAGAQYQATPFPAAPAQPLHVGTSFVPAAGDTALGSLLNVRQHLGTLAASIANNSSNRFAAGVQALRLAITPRFEGSDAGVDSRLTSTGAANIGTAGELFDPAAPGAYNVRAYTVGQTGGVSGADPSGGEAGLYARIDVSRGVWKAPAGLEANLLGVRGVEHRMTDADNGTINPQAVNAIRQFPNGIVSWGARTMVGFDNSGNDDFKYVPVRRLTLMIEESLYRGLGFAVFEPNDEPLWAQIRLAAGSFMNGLFRQGAFKGAKASDAYFVKCDAETTTQNDIDLGIVNVVVGFAPLKPAEFVIVVVRQIAGQAQT